MTRIRKFSKKDMDDVIKIARSSLNVEYDPRMYISIWELFPDGFFVAEEGGRIVGFIAGIIENKDEGKVLMLAVQRHFRRRGIGTALMNEFLKICNMFAIKRVYLEVRIRNKKAIDFYMSMGFSKNGVYPRYYEDGEDALVMWKNL